MNEACEKYFWHGNYHSNLQQLTCLRGRLGKALDRGNEREAGCVVFDIFRWGGVGRGRNSDWVKESVNNHALCASINDGVSLLRNREADLHRFGKSERGLPMNSSMTKVYAMADREGFLIIYDGRVGAALAHLARLFLQQGKAPNVPSDLNYRWGTSRSVKGAGQDPRNPSTLQYKFHRWFGPHSDFDHATNARCASFLISDCAKACGVSPRRFEAALFMWGYRIA